MLDIDDSPNQEDVAAVLDNQRSRIKHWKRVSIQSGLTFATVAGLTSLFLAGMPLHFLWEQIGKYLLMACYPAMIWALYAAVSLWLAHSQHRQFRETYSTEEK